MRGKLPVYIENRSLPNENKERKQENYSYGYVSVMSLLSLIITGISLLTIYILGK